MQRPIASCHISEVISLVSSRKTATGTVYGVAKTRAARASFEQSLQSDRMNFGFTALRHGLLFYIHSHLSTKVKKEIRRSTVASDNPVGLLAGLFGRTTLVLHKKLWLTSAMQYSPSYVNSYSYTMLYRLFDFLHTDFAGASTW